jgi:hypothetical protein
MKKLTISFKNWKKTSITWLNNIAYVGLALVASIQAAEYLNYPLDFITPHQKQIIVFSVIAFKFIEKMTSAKEVPNTFEGTDEEPAEEPKEEKP